MAEKPVKYFFDLDGTLIDVSTRHYAVYSKIAQSFSGSPLPKVEYWQYKQDKMGWPELLEKTGISSDRSPEFLDQFISLIEQPAMLTLDTLFPEVTTILSALGRANVYLVTLRRNDANVRKELQDLGLVGHFEKIITGHTENEGADLKVELMKPYVDEGSVMIGDTEADILAAKRLGMQSVAVLSGIRSKRFLEALEPDYIVDDINALLATLKQ